MKPKSMNIFNLLWHIILRPAGYWFVVLIPTAFTIARSLGWNNEIISKIPLELWIITSILCIGVTLLISTYRYKQELEKSKEKDFQPPLQNVTATASGGNAYAVGRDLHIHSPTQQERTENADWNNVNFKCFEKGIIIENHKNEIIQKSYLEIIEIYSENRKTIDDSRKEKLPAIVSWNNNGKLHYDETDIRIGKQKYFVLVFDLQIWVFESGPPYYYIGGQNGFQYDLAANKTCFVEVEISGMIGTTSLLPKRKFIEVCFDGQEVKIKNIFDELP